MKQHDLLGDHLSLSLLGVKLWHRCFDWSLEICTHLILLIDRNVLVKVRKSCPILSLRDILWLLRVLVQEIRLASLFLSQGCVECLLVFLDVSHNSNHFYEFSRLFLNLIHSCLLHQKI